MRADAGQSAGGTPSRGAAGRRSNTYLRPAVHRSDPRRADDDSGLKLRADNESLCDAGGETAESLAMHQLAVCGVSSGVDSTPC